MIIGSCCFLPGCRNPNEQSDTAASDAGFQKRLASAQLALEKLHSEDAETVLVGGHDFIGMDLTGLISHLLPEINDILMEGSPDAKSSVLIRLRRMGKDAEAALPAIRSCLDDEDRLVREGAKHAIDLIMNPPKPRAKMPPPHPGHLSKGYWADQDNRTLLENLTSSNHDVATLVGRELYNRKFGPAERPLIPQMVRLLEHNDTSNHTLVLTLFFWMEKDARLALPAIRRCLKSPDKWVRNQALEMIEDLEVPTSRPSNSEASDAKTKKRLTKARTALEQLRSKDSKKVIAGGFDLIKINLSGLASSLLPEMIDILRQGPVDAKIFVIISLKPMGKDAEAALPAIEAFVNDDDPLVSDWAKETIDGIRNPPEVPVKLPPPPEEHLNEAYWAGQNNRTLLENVTTHHQDVSILVRGELLRRDFGSDDKPLIPLIVKLLGHENGEIQEAVLSALRTMRGDACAALPGIRKCMESENLSVRMMARSAIEWVEEPSRRPKEPFSVEL